MSESASTKRRTKAEMQVLDEKIRPLYKDGLGCRKIAADLGESPAVVYKRVRAMGLIRSYTQAQTPAPVIELPFSCEEDGNHLRVASIGEAVSWFLRRGYVASVPMAVAQYDLVVESDDGFKRVQVKSTTRRDKYGRWSVGIARMEYGYTPERSANGTRKRRPYRPEEIDLFFISTVGREKYLVPLEATCGASSLTLDEKYLIYRIE